MGKECTEVENFSDGERFLGRQGERWRAAEATPMLSPGFPFLPPVSVLLSSKICFRLPGGRRSSVATSRVEGKDFDGVEPEAAKREPTLGG